MSGFGGAGPWDAVSETSEWGMHFDWNSRRLYNRRQLRRKIIKN